MNSWSTNRKRLILFLVIIVLGVLIGGPVYFFFHKEPTCFDQKQNADETGVDCGGSCTLVCTTETLPLIMKGDPRVIRVATSTYEVIAHIQNPNVSAQVLLAPYTFNLYGANSAVPLKTIQGKTFIPKNTSFVLFEGPFQFSGEMPTRATFTFDDGALVWEKNLNNVPELRIEDSTLLTPNTEPRLEAIVTNPTLSAVSNIEFVALVSDESGNIIGSSKTFVDNLNPNESAPLVFVWPASFVGKPNTFEVVPRILPNRSYIR
jgi:hypothetical protein